MKRIEIDRDIINVPESWDDITLGFYETWFHKAPTNRKEQIALVAEICKMDEEKLLNYPIQVCNIILDTLRFAFTETNTEPSPSIQIAQLTYTIPITENLSTGAWIDLEEAQKEQVKMLSSILAITCLPTGETYDTRKTEQRQKMFAELKMSQVLPLLAFFLHYKKKLENRSAMFSKAMESVKQYANNTKNSQSVGVGTRLSQKWHKIQSFISRKSLHSPSQKSSPSSDTKSTERKPKKHKENLKSKSNNN